MATPQTQRTFPEVLQDIAGNLQEIVRSEFRLAKTEVREAADRAARPTAIFMSGLVAGLYGTGFLLLACIYGLATVMAAWLAALVVGGSLAITAAILLVSGSKRLKGLSNPVHKTVASVEENVQWTKHPTK
jgi:Putative Actinobacterial Holin-X, holin superfamily III